MKKFHFFLNSLFIFLFCLSPFTANAEAITGSCGETLYWSFDTETGHLDITGSGKMNLTKHPAWTKKNITITSVSFPESITSIDSYAFEEQEIAEIVIPASVETFGKDAFVNMLSLLRFTYERIGYSNTQNGILRNCKNLRYFHGNSRMLSYNDNIDTIIVTYGPAVNSWFQPTYIDNSYAYDTRLSGKYDETPKLIRTYFFPSELEVIGDFYLCNAPEVTGMTIPTKVHSIGKGAFLNCTSMDSLVFLGDAIETIADSAFYNCSNLTYIRLQDTIPPTIHENTFYNVDRSIPVFVPLNSKEQYQQAPYWEEFYNIIEPSLSTNIEETQSSDFFESKNADFNDKKVLYNNQLIIIHNGKTYNTIGALLN
jgi:hypothetical protein